MKKVLASYQNVADMLRTNKPRRPVYCIYPELYRETAAEFVNSFAGRVLYAVKANDHPEVIRLLVEGGVRHFDCASLAEIEAVKRISPEAACYFMTPVRLRGAAREAQSQYGVRHFMIDHQSGLDSLVAEIDLEKLSRLCPNGRTSPIGNAGLVDTVWGATGRYSRLADAYCRERGGGCTGI